MILSLHDLQQTEQHIITRMDLQAFLVQKNIVLIIIHQGVSITTPRQQEKVMM